MGPQKALRTLLVDNYDSYTYNLYQWLAEVNGEPPVVIENDELPWGEVESMIKDGMFDNIVISPGPGTPERPQDIGVCTDILRECPGIPILGVCMGHEALGLVSGARVVHAPEPYHGRLSEIAHTGKGLFRGLPSGWGSGYRVVRYHSLVLDAATLPDCLEVTAWVAGEGGGGDVDGYSGGAGELVMAVAHRSRPHHGVQFHPESIETSEGKALLANFAGLTREWWAAHGPPGGRGERPARPRLEGLGSCIVRAAAEEEEEGGEGAGAGAGPGPGPAPPASPWEIHWAKAAGVLSDPKRDAETLFWGLYGGGSGGCEPEPEADTCVDTFWLDSANCDKGRARFSFMGGPGGPGFRRVTYRLAVGSLPDPAAAEGVAVPPHPPGRVTVSAGGEGGEEVEERVWDYLARELEARRVVDREAEEALPFNFWGGFVGYLGYELKVECGAAWHHPSPTPDAAFLLADRVLVIDHETGDLYAVAAGPRGGGRPAWVDDVISTAGEALAGPGGDPRAAAAGGGGAGGAGAAGGGGGEGSFRLRRSHATYVEDVRAIHEALRDGESYEVCLTTALVREGPMDARALYSTLREVNPAPYGAWFRFGGGGPTVCCSSPERFLRLERGGELEAKPIKGTIARGSTPEEDAASAAALRTSEKDRSENLMIVDLLRNDLGRVCEIGSVHCPKLMDIESYASVHQLVSTVRGRRQDGRSAVECVRAAFPGGSMTGAPKVRTMRIIDEIEKGPRGVYSGSLGFLSFNDTFDLNIVIRTAVVHGGRTVIGAGGAVVIMSDPEGEYQEMRLKAKNLLKAVAVAESWPGGPAAAEALVDEDHPYGPY